MSGFDKAAAIALLENDVAPWVGGLNLEIVSLAADKVVVKMPFSEALCREGGTICGQSLMALADTAMVFAVAAASGGNRPMTTVDTTVHFMKPASSDAVICTVKMMRLGRTMAFGHAVMTGEREGKPIASATLAYALLGPVNEDK